MREHSLVALRDHLLKEKAVVVNRNDEFVLKSGRMSPFFFDIKTASMNPELLNEMMWGVLNTVAIAGYQRLASVAIGSVPLTTALSLHLNIPQIIVRESVHDRGMKSRIIGTVEDRICLLIEDVATSGRSLVYAVEAIRKAGGICDDVVVMIDREEGAEELCKEHNIRLFPVLKKFHFEMIPGVG